MASPPEPSSTAPTRTDPTQRWLYLAGVAGPVVFWVTIAVLGFLTPGYSHVHDAISDLGAIGAPYGTVQQVNFVVLGLGVLAFCVAVHRQFRRGSRPWVGVVLVGLLGLLGAIGSGVFPVDPAEGAQLTDQLHGIGVIVGFHAGLVGIPLTSWRLSGRDGWPGYRSRSAVLAITAGLVAAYAAFIYSGSRSRGTAGWHNGSTPAP